MVYSLFSALKFHGKIVILGSVMAQQGNQANNPQAQAQPNIQQLNQAQRQQQLREQMVQQQQMETNIKQTQPTNPIPNNPMQANPMQTNPLQSNPMQNQNQNLNQGQGMSHSQQMGTQQQWNFNQMNQLQGTSAQNQPANPTQPQPQPQQFFNQTGMNRFERPQLNNPTSKQALSMMLAGRQRHPPAFINSGNNPQQANIGGLPFNMAQRQQIIAQRNAALRNVNPAQMQAAAAANNQMNVNNIGNQMMSGGGMVQQRQVIYTYICTQSLYEQKSNRCSTHDSITKIVLNF